MNETTPLYQQIKDYICQRIDRGIWKVDQRVPSENDLVAELGASRMTVHRALRELTSEGRLRRARGQGTFVADARPQAELLEIRNIADEIRSRGHRHRCVVRRKGARKADGWEADQLGLKAGSRVFHSLLVHYEDDKPVQVEDRLVNPAVAPNYLDIDFTLQTPNEYLMVSAPLSQVEHIVDAIMPDEDKRALLEIGPGEPCLLLHRRTWSGGRVASLAWLTHPSSRYRLGARFAAANRANAGSRRRERVAQP